MANPKIMINFAVAKAKTRLQRHGVMLEWLKRHAWKACVRQKRTASSNLAHSAVETTPESVSVENVEIFSGEMAEWSIAAVLKTVEGNTSGGSNPSLSAKRQTKVL